ncbi:glycosyltransferase family 15 protein [Postia placenta MAD-698-R-SB12]|uniref:Glycosyltransferase family 15 protein n=1 Tax=Postia placenta MAD-698-R-SB12 TaxID=670580 RepID=A0A1X6N2K9_9APHY|nr:glycosyltransferase family 15 protein [Postia placenta MAD-698-R-SB12]OSX62706.1 glycosyltransferase family 15 protein [Postia placenta MAD-698-R-SB12]
MPAITLSTPGRYVLLVLLVLLGIHSILSLTHHDYARVTSVSRLAGWGTPSPPAVPTDYFHPAPPANASARANATLLMLARNADTESAVRSVRELEQSFNQRFNYPWVFLNDDDFSDDFKTRISNVVSGPVSFGRVPREHWVQPASIDEDRARAGREKMEKDGIIYGGSLSYRNMCRFNSGFFYRHPLLQQYRWYWRVEPDVHFHCDTPFDPFRYLADHGKVYGFTITMYEYEATIPTLWETTKEFMRLHPEHVAQDNAMGYISDNGGETYNLCHFWSNFEIADMDFWRGDAYSAYFDFLDAKGGFYYERWGDAPVHSLAAALFARKEQIHLFDEIGYEHNPYTHCPRGAGAWARGRCSCNPQGSFDYDGYSCMRQWDRIQ